MEWAHELVNGYKADNARSSRSSRGRARSSSRSSTPTASTPRARPASSRAAAAAAARRTRGGQRDREHRLPPAGVPAQELPLPRGRGRLLRPAGVRRRLGRRRPEPQLRRLLGRRGRERRPDQRGALRPRPVLRARDAERPRPGLEAPGRDADHQPHVLEPGAAPAGPAGPGRDARRADLQGARRRDDRRERLLERPVVRALRHDRDDRGLELLRHRRPRLHVRDRLRRRRTRRPASARPATSTRRSPRWSRSTTARRRSRTRTAATARATARRTSRLRSTRRTSPSTRC